jgi:hypothetical protein
MYSGPAVQPGTAMTAHGDEVRWHIAAGPFLELRMTARQRSGLGSRGRSTYALPYPPQTARRHKQKQCPPRRTNHRTLYRISFVTRSVRRTHTFSLTTSARCIRFISTKFQKNGFFVEFGATDKQNQLLVHLIAGCCGVLLHCIPSIPHIPQLPLPLEELFLVFRTRHLERRATGNGKP